MPGIAKLSSDLCWDAGLAVSNATENTPLRNEYRVIGKSNASIRWVRQLAKWGACTAVLVFLGKYAGDNWSALAEARVLSPHYLYLSAVFGVVGCVGSALCCVTIVKSHGFSLPLAGGIGLVYVPRLGKYVPGKIWTVVGALWIFEQIRIPRVIAIAYIGLSTGLGLASAAVLGVGFVILGSSRGNALWIPALMGAGLAFLVHPAVFYPALNWALRIFGREEVKTRVSTRVIALLLGINLLVLLSLGMGFACIVKSMCHDSVSVEYCISLFIFSQIAGFLALFAPGGIGVREGIVIAGLAPITGPGPAVLVSVISRVWLTLLEVVMAGIGWVGLVRMRDERQRGSTLKREHSAPP